MNKFTYLALAAVPAFVFTSCTKSAEDFATEICELMEEMATILEKTTPENADDQAEELKVVVAELKQLRDEVEKRAEEDSEFKEYKPSAEIEERMKKAMGRLVKAVLKLGEPSQYGEAFSKAFKDMDL